MPELVYIALGSNLGDRDAALRTARHAIAGMQGTRIVAESAVEETDPIGPIPQGKYLNQMIAVSTDLEPRTLLAALHDVERSGGRVRSVRWEPRTIDLDIVMIEGKQYNDDELTVPHPELPRRDFWLRQLGELRGGRDD